MALSSTWKKPKFKALARALRSRALAIGTLECLWAAGCQAGDDLIGSTEDVESECDWHGKRGVLAALLEQLHWIDVTPRGYVIHDFWEHAPSYVKKKHNTRKKSGESPEKVPTESRESQEKVSLGSSRQGRAGQGEAEAGLQNDQTAATVATADGFAYQGERLVVSNLDHARLARLYPVAFLIEQYPAADLKFSTTVPAHEEVNARRCSSWIVAWCQREWDHVRKTGDESRYQSGSGHHDSTPHDVTFNPKGQAFRDGKRAPEHDLH